MARLAAIVLALCALCPAPAARAEPVYDFVTNCRHQRLGDCFALINERLNVLNSGAHPSICLPRAFGGLMLGDGVVPVSLLEHVRVKLSAARFGHSGDDANATIASIINRIYPCERPRAAMAPAPAARPR